ncbi:SIR2 family protein [Baekduia sp. Peel2402]|uniref:SIR2 family protein n=1 Tax=Baekduia sp. Peel2402 TaxID=3458296 RepID=UPI00403EB984
MTAADPFLLALSEMVVDRVNEPLTIHSAAVQDTLGEREHLLAGLVSSRAGVLIDANDPVFQMPLVCAEKPELKILLRSLIKPGDFGPGADVQLEHQHGAVDAKLRLGDTIGTPGSAHAQALALLRALFDDRLHATEFAVITYSEFEMRHPLRKACLRYLMSIAPAFTNLRTLLIFAQTDKADISVHCQFRRGIRFYISRDGLQRRNPSEMLDADAQAFALTAREQAAVLFLGAGFSASSRMPLGNTLRDSALTDLLGRPSEHMTNAQRGRALRRAFSGRGVLTSEEEDPAVSDDQLGATLTLEKVIRMHRAHGGPAIPRVLGEFKQSHDSKLANGYRGRAVTDLQAIAERGGHRLVVITVNFDELLEHDSDAFDVAVTDADFRRIAKRLPAYLDGTDNDPRVPYLKLHGTITKTSTCIISDADTMTGLPHAKETAVLTLLRHQVAPRIPWFFVGASMRDYDLEGLYKGSTYIETVEEHWVAPLPEASIYEFANRREVVWGHDVQRRLVTETADVFFARLRRLLEAQPANSP